MEHRWASILFRQLKHIKNESLFQQSFEVDIQRFRRNNSSLYANNKLSNSIEARLRAEGTMEDEFKDSCLIPEDEFSKGDAPTG